MRVRDLLLTLVLLVFSFVVLCVFLPPRLVWVIVGVVAVTGVLAFVWRRSSLSPRWKGVIGTIVVVAVLFTTVSAVLMKKYPWLDRALEGRQIYTSFWATDRVDPRYPSALARSLYETHREQLKREEQVLITELKVYQRAISRGQPLLPHEQARLDYIGQWLRNMDKELSEFSLARRDRSAPPRPQIEYSKLTTASWTEIVLPYGAQYRMYPVDPGATVLMEVDGVIYETTGRSNPWVPVFRGAPLVPEPLPAVIRLKAKPGQGQVTFKVVTWKP